MINIHYTEKKILGLFVFTLILNDIIFNTRGIKIQF